METWRCGVREDSISLRGLARFLGVGRKTGHDADFAPLFDMNRDAALDYLLNDLHLKHRCAVALGLLPPTDSTESMLRFAPTSPVPATLSA